MNFFGLVLFLVVGSCFGKDPKIGSDLEGSESSQSYGYGYGTKVADQYGESTVYVHGFGTTNDADESYNDYHNEVIPHISHPAPYEKPVYGHYTPAPYQAPYHAPALEPYQAPAPAPYQLPVYHPKPYGTPAYYEKPGYTRGYGYGHIDGYGNARHGYGFAKQYGYEAPAYAEHAPSPAAYHPGPLGVPPTPLAHGGHLTEEVPHTPSLGHGFGYGFSHFQ